jgi:putative tricarboxylic transport membrane protein
MATKSPAPPVTGPDEVAATATGPDRGAVLASAVLGTLMVLLAAVVLIDAARLPDTDATVGPEAAPILVGVLLAAAGATLAVRSVLALRGMAAGEALPRERLVRLGAMVALLVAFALLLPFLGYVLTSAALFTGAALLLGAPNPWRTLAYGWTLAAVVFLVFDRLIGLTLPTGPWGF